jgi:predicted amidophosphoribosyltransferase
MKLYKKIPINERWLTQLCGNYSEQSQGSAITLSLRDSTIDVPVCPRCKQMISRRNKSGYCKICYDATIRREHIPTQYVLEGDNDLTVAQMAKKYNTNPGTISKWLKIRGMPRNRKV